MPCHRRAQGRTERPLSVTIIFLSSSSISLCGGFQRLSVYQHQPQTPALSVTLHPKRTRRTTASMAAPGGTSLSNLLASMEPILQPGNFVFATVPPSDTTFLSRIQTHSFEMLFRESEGWTLIANQSTVETLGLEAIFPCRKVTLGVHSSLDAVGFMAAVTTRLAKIDIGVNPVSGFYHDHL